MRANTWTAAAVFATGWMLETAAYGQVPLVTDQDGTLDVQAVTCGQLANTFQEDADALTMWYSGWYNGLAKKHVVNLTRARALEHEVIVYCKVHQDEKVIKVIGDMLKQEKP